AIRTLSPASGGRGPSRRPPRRRSCARGGARAAGQRRPTLVIAISQCTAPMERSDQIPRSYFPFRRCETTRCEQVGIELADNVEAVQEAERRKREIDAGEVGVIIVEDEREDRIAVLSLDIN